MRKHANKAGLLMRPTAATAPLQTVPVRGAYGRVRTAPLRPPGKVADWSAQQREAYRKGMMSLSKTSAARINAFYDEITQIEKTASSLKNFWGLFSGRTTRSARGNLGLSKAEYKQLRANRDAKAKALKAGQDSVKPGGMKNFNQKLKEFFGSAGSSTGGLSKKLDAEAALRKAERGQLQARLLVGSGLLGGAGGAWGAHRAMSKKRKK